MGGSLEEVGKKYRGAPQSTAAASLHRGPSLEVEIIDMSDSTLKLVFYGGV